MEITIELTHGPINALPPQPASGQVGAWVRFEGLVRDAEGGQRIAALEYEGYEAMASREIRRLLEEIALRYACLEAHVIHRLGRVPVGEAAILVQAFARHRAEAFGLVTEFMDRLKQDVPIWKLRGIPASTS